MRESGKYTWREIGDALGISPDTCQKNFNARYHTNTPIRVRSHVKPGAHRKKDQGPERKCSCCGQPFNTTPERKRLCGPCYRGGDAQESYRVAWS